MFLKLALLSCVAATVALSLGLHDNNVYNNLRHQCDANQLFADHAPQILAQVHEEDKSMTA